MFKDCIEELKYCAHVLFPGTCTQMYYLRRIHNLRRITNNRSVILVDHCITVI